MAQETQSSLKLVETYSGTGVKGFKIHCSYCARSFLLAKDLSMHEVRGVRQSIFLRYIPRKYFTSVSPVFTLFNAENRKKTEMEKVLDQNTSPCFAAGI